jgi:hypothetical protein
MNTGSKVTLVGVLILLSCGCSIFGDPNGVVTIGTEKSRMVIMQADKRAIFTFPNRQAYACPEPSPDVKTDIDTALKSLAEVSAKLPNDVTATAKSELEATRKLIMTSLLQRSQGLQVLRDMLFQACLANLRGDMDPKVYGSFVTVTLPNLTTTLITSEMVTKTNGDKPVLSGPDLNSFLQFVIGNTFAE